MKTFRNLVVIRRPQPELWRTMRDHLVEFAGSIADIENVRQIERTMDPSGNTRITNEWRVRQQIPAAIRSMLKIDALGWIDRNTWDDAAKTCTCTIEPGFLREHIACSGQTIFAEGMGGRGTRVTFSGELDIKPGMIGSLGGLEAVVTAFIESVVTTIVPRNLRAVVEAAAAFELPADRT